MTAAKCPHSPKLRATSPESSNEVWLSHQRRLESFCPVQSDPVHHGVAAYTQALCRLLHGIDILLLEVGAGVSGYLVRGALVRHAIAGCEPLEVARKINYSLHAVERCLHFAREVFLWGKAFEPLQIALTVGISSANV
jgi:hypothetical protein